MPRNCAPSVREEDGAVPGGSRVIGRGETLAGGKAARAPINPADEQGESYAPCDVDPNHVNSSSDDRSCGAPESADIRRISWAQERFCLVRFGAAAAPPRFYTGPDPRTEL